MQLKDTHDSYGWLSIVLHWFAAVVIMLLWIVGNTFSTADAELRAQLQSFHVSLGSAALVILLFRTGWRLFHRHPVVRGRSVFFHRVGVVAHYFLLICVLAMLVSGPMMIWTQGLPINMFEWLSFPSPMGPDDELYRLARNTHIVGGAILVWGIVLHIAGAFKHFIFDDDETFVRIFWPRKEHEGSRK